MNAAALTLALLNCLFIITLPLTFFQKGSYNLKWLITGTPFGLMAIVHILAAVLDWQPLGVSGAAWTATTVVATVLLTGSVALIGLTVGTHRIPLALWHQDDDAPASIVTYGPYSVLRHPFYTAFIIYGIAGVLLFPHLLTLLVLSYIVIALNATAAREERRLAASEFGSEYQEYMRTAGRFTPKIRGRA